MGDAQARRLCPVVAEVTRGAWQGDWRLSAEGMSAVCVIQGGAVPVMTLPAEVPLSALRDAADAAYKCPLVARTVNGQWTGEWTPLLGGRSAGCTIKAW